MMLRKVFCVLLVVSLFLPLAGVVSAKTVTVDDEYDSTDSVEGDGRNTYYITADSGKEIKYEVKAKDGGKFELYFSNGHTSTPSTYYVLYSADEPVSSFKKTFSVGSDDGEDFSINIDNQENTTLTYTISVKVQKTPWWMYAAGCGVIIGIAAVIGIVKRAFR